MELWDLYDRDRNKTGEICVRGKGVPEGRYHMVVHICIFNSQGELLIQKRSESKPLWSGKWDLSVGGAAQSGDSSWQAAQREVKEELGLDIDFSKIRPSLTINFDNGFDDIYLLNLDFDDHKLHLQSDEVTEVRWTDEEGLHEMIKKEEFVPYHHSLISLIFDLRTKKGAFSKVLKKPKWSGFVIASD